MTIARDTNRLTPAPGLETELNAWLRELGHDEPRRIVRQDANAMLLSRFEEGFAARLMANVRVVILGPKTISRGEAALSRSAMASCAACSSASLSRLVRKRCAAARRA